MKKNINILISFFVFIIVVVSLFLFRDSLRDIGSNNTYTNLNTYFKVKDNEVALIYNNELQTAKAIEKDGNYYLPLNWVSSILNDKFYFSTKDELLIYTLPDNILYSDYNTLGQDGKNLLLKENGEAYISLSIISTYTNIVYNTYTDKDVKRLFINNNFNEYLKATTKYKTRLRVGKSNDSEVVKEVAGGEELSLVLDDISDESVKSKSLTWVKVATNDGYIGYIKKSDLRAFVKSRLKSDFKEVKYTNISLGKKVVLAWHQLTTTKANSGLESLLDNEKGINVVSPTWFSLSDNQGNYTSIASKEYIEKAHKKNIQVWALIDNFNKNISTLEILSSTKSRQNLINNLIKDAKNLGLDGINIDFEALKQETGKHYIQFIRELSIETRKNNIILSIDNPNYASFNTFYSRAKQAEVADYIINMGYDEHFAGGEKGSVASLNFVKEGIDGSLTEVPKEKFINAIPVYTRVWTDVDSKALSIKAAKEWIEKNDVKLEWDDELGQYYGEKEVDSKMSYIWMEEEKSLGLKIDYMKNKEIAGVAIWKLGLEPDTVWDIIDRIN